MCGTDQPDVIGWEKKYLREPRGRTLRKYHQVAKAYFNSVSVGALCVRKHGKWNPPTTPYPLYGPGYDDYCVCGSTLKGDRPHVPARANTSDMLGSLA
jgi:hypothetical protein